MWNSVTKVSGVRWMGVGSMKRPEVLRGRRSDYLSAHRGKVGIKTCMPFIGTKQTHTSGVSLSLVSHDTPGKLRAECLPTQVNLHAQLSQFMKPAFWCGAENPAAAQNVVAKFGQSMSLSKVYYRADLFTDARPDAGQSCVWAGLKPVLSSGANRAGNARHARGHAKRDRPGCAGSGRIRAQGIMAGRGYRWVGRDACLPLVRVRGAEHESGIRPRRFEYRVPVERRNCYTH